MSGWVSPCSKGGSHTRTHGELGDLGRTAPACSLAVLSAVPTWCWPPCLPCHVISSFTSRPVASSPATQLDLSAATLYLQQTGTY